MHHRKIAKNAFSFAEINDYTNIMNWIINFFTSSIGKKIIMSLTGLFLCSFLLIHLIGNLQLLYNDGGKAFDVYAKFMGGNPIIKFVSFGLYGSILLHAIQGILLYFENKKARGSSQYAVSYKGKSSSASAYMAVLGTVILVYILGHLAQFWYAYKFGEVAAGKVGYYEAVLVAFKNPLFVALYVIAQIFIALHLLHGFQSAFQTLGLNHKKYTPIIKGVGTVYSILIPLGFAIIPIFMYLFR